MTLKKPILILANELNSHLIKPEKDFKKHNEVCHIRLQQRNGRKSLTTIQGLNEKLDIEKITKTLKKDFCCNGCITEDPMLGKIIQLQGDQRENVMKFFLEESILLKKKVKIHGI
ncbi:translation factor sui1 (nucleomorph) [Chroomonas mesostigmatica CCMP1168]|uniref:Translation factor sui1 n=1 Tax=Chroomonas mesostigmatica CCMP1168 TaxID=1195612 RepID=J7G596_9CRYP|nr:translation factor sui1 [Chroomonas mesostigmatica CCMP1168]|mmetsp:Transcript_66791/g.164620  ORF Transcript_66791/g.164620 Transcript_66791/m.164620 type:complete len:115 (-) Transcript_66791:386-730(-)